MRPSFARIDETRQNEVILALDKSAAVSRDYLVLVVLSCVIATFGLVLDSAPVIIGAMLIAPLMSPILACSLALVCGDVRRVGRAVLALAVGLLLAIALSAALGRLAATGELNFLEQLPGEILGRTRPTLFDLVVALAGGAAAAYALAQPHLSATLPGVAIATALMPPTCVVGIGISQGRADVSYGALLLFVANLVAIVFASVVVFVAAGFGARKLAWRPIVAQQALLFSAALLVLIALPLVGFMVQIANDAQENETIRAALTARLAAIGEGANLVSFERHGQDNRLDLVATVRSPRVPTYEEARAAQTELAARLQKTVALKLLVVPITQLDPLVPPTPTATRSPGAPTATTVPAVLPTSSPTPPPGPTAAPSPTATPRATPIPLPSPTATPSLQPTPTPVAYAVVGATDRAGANVRRDPGLTPRLTALPDGIVVQLTGRRTEAAGYAWVEVVLPDGRVGWIAAEYLVPYEVYRQP